MRIFKEHLPLSHQETCPGNNAENNKETVRKTVAIYCRVSSDKQVKERTVVSQLEALKKFAENNNFHVEKDLLFIDEGISGATLVRPALDSLRDKAVSGEIETVLVLCPDRLSRKYAHQLILIEEFKRLGVDVIFSDSNRSDDNPENRLLLNVQGVISEYEREKIMERNRRGRLQKAKQGSVNVLSSAPYGYIYNPKSNTGDASYEINFGEAEIVETIFKMFCDNKKAIRSIARNLNERGIPARKGGQWNASSVCSILKNPACKGTAAFGKSKMVERSYKNKLSRERNSYSSRAKTSHRCRAKSEWIYIPVPSIISEKTFDIARNQLQKNKKFSLRNNKKFNYLLSGLLRCDQCGYALSGHTSKSGDKYLSYYRCSGEKYEKKSESGDCRTWTRMEVLDELVWNQVVKLIERPDVVLNEYTNRINVQKNDKCSLQDLIKKKTKEIKRHGREKDRLVILYQQGLLEISDVKTPLEKLKSAIKILEQEKCSLMENERKGNGQLQLIKQFDIFKNEIAKNLKGLSFQQKKEILRLLVEEVIVHKVQNRVKIRHIIPELRPPVPEDNHSTYDSERSASFLSSIMP